MKFASIVDSVFENGYASENGGAIVVKQINQMEIKGQTKFRRNYAGEQGGALMYECFDNSLFDCNA